MTVEISTIKAGPLGLSLALAASALPLTPVGAARAGGEFDQTPIPNDGRSTAVPDNNRTWLALGASYQIDDRVGHDISFAHDFTNSTQISRVDALPSLPTTATATNLKRDTSNVIGIAMRFRY